MKRLLIFSPYSDGNGQSRGQTYFAVRSNVPFLLLSLNNNLFISWAIINRCDFKLRVIISYYPNKDIGNFKGKKYNGC